MKYKEYKRNIKISSAFNKVLSDEYLNIQKYLNTISDGEKTPEGYMVKDKCLFIQNQNDNTISINSIILETLTFRFGMELMESNIFITEFINDILGTSYSVDDLFISIV